MLQMQITSLFSEASDENGGRGMSRAKMQIKFTIEADVVSVFKARCKSEGVSNLCSVDSEA